MSVIVKTVLVSNIKTRWREPFASEAINKRGVGTLSPGAYRGLNLEAPSPPVDLTVTVASDATVGDHIGVAETVNGFSVNYVNDGGDFNLDLSSVLLINQTVVITLEISYSVGIDTTGDYVAYTLAEYNALSAPIRNGLITLGTVVVPGSGVIPAANISANRRSFPGDRQVGTPLNRVTRNGSFEASESGGLENLTFMHWRTSITPTAGNANLVSHTADSNSGTKSVELDVTGVGVFDFQITQDINVPVLESQLVRVRLFKKVLAAAIAGTATVGVSYRDVDGNPIGAQTSVFVVNAIDAAFSEEGSSFFVPAGAFELAFIQIAGTGVDYAGTGSSLLVDDVELFIEDIGTNQDLAHEVRGSGAVVGALTLEEEGKNYADVGASMRFQEALGGAGGGVALDTKDGSVGTAPDFIAKGAIDIGASLLGSIANADIPRIVAPPSMFAGVEYTLINESLPAGDKGYRMYISPTGTGVRTVNAKWNNTTNLWSKDVNGQPASRRDLSNTGESRQTQISGTNSWADGAWLGGGPWEIYIPASGIGHRVSSGPTFDADLHLGAFQGAAGGAAMMELQVPISGHLREGDEVLTVRLDMLEAGGTTMACTMFEQTPPADVTAAISDVVSSAGPGDQSIVLTSIDFNSSTNIIESAKAYMVLCTTAATGNVTTSYRFYGAFVTYNRSAF